jgi:hypothetical protein
MDLKQSRMSSANAAGRSSAAKCPPCRNVTSQKGGREDGREGGGPHLFVVAVELQVTRLLRPHLGSRRDLFTKRGIAKGLRQVQRGVSVPCTCTCNELKPL